MSINQGKDKGQAWTNPFQREKLGLKSNIFIFFGRFSDKLDYVLVRVMFASRHASNGLVPMTLHNMKVFLLCYFASSPFYLFKGIGY